MIRFDDLTGEGAHWVFDRPTAAGRAESLDQVRTVITDAEHRATEHGEWVVITIAYEAAQAFATEMATHPAPPDGTPYVWWQSFGERRTAAPLARTPTRVVSRHRRPNRRAYPDAVADVRRRIEAGDVYQVNVTDRFEGRFTGSPLEVYAGLIGVQACRHGAYIEMGERTIASASPELFFRWDGATITCRPMKGTAPRRPRPADDDRAAGALASSAKERAENVMIVDLLRNDLGRIALTGTVTVPERFALERYETVWQLTSTVQAELPDDTELLDVLDALFPCGSVTGAPKLAAMGAIVDLEAEPRGIYCGAIGLLAPPGLGPRAVFSVPIRTAVLDAVTDTYEYGAGGGITWSSEPDDEDAEVLAKTRILTRSHRDVSLLETLRNDAAGLVNAAAHLDRMEASAGWFGIPFDRASIEECLHAIPPARLPQRIRLLVDRSGVLTVEQHVLDDAPSPVLLAVDDHVTRSDDPYCCHKTTWRRHYDLARARVPDADDVVLVNEHGRAVETTIANLAYRIGDQWHCPPLTDGGLAGIGRRRAIEAGRVVERSILARELIECDEIAVVNDLRGWRTALLSDRSPPLR